MEQETAAVNLDTMAHGTTDYGEQYSDGIGKEEQMIQVIDMVRRGMEVTEIVEEEALDRP